MTEPEMQAEIERLRELLLANDIDPEPSPDVPDRGLTDNMLGRLELWMNALNSAMPRVYTKTETPQ